jgi:hypothetical protein
VSPDGHYPLLRVRVRRHDWPRPTGRKIRMTRFVFGRTVFVPDLVNGIQAACSSIVRTARCRHCQQPLT